MDGTDVNGVYANETRTMLAVGDDRGRMSVFRYPLMKNTQDGHILSGHSEHVPRVAFCDAVNEQGQSIAEYVVSAGGNDHAYMQWAPKEYVPPDPY